MTTYVTRHIGTVTVQAESEAALEAMLLSYWTPQSVGRAAVRECDTCLHIDLDGRAPPCRTCSLTNVNWEPRP